MQDLEGLNKNIKISDEEQVSKSLTRYNLQLAMLLLVTRGYVILKNALPPDLVEDLKKSYFNIYKDCQESYEEGNDNIQLSNKENTYFYNKKARFRIFPRLVPPFNNELVVSNPLAFQVLEGLLGDGFYCKSVSSDTCTNEAILQSPHRDIDFYKNSEPYGYIVNIPLVHCGLHNGPLEVWPGGSHIWQGKLFKKFEMQPNVQDGRNPEIEEFAEYFAAKKIEFHPGDILLRDPGMWHRGTLNPTTDPRIMLTISYFRKDFFYNYGNPKYNVDSGIYENLLPETKKVFNYMFNKKKILYWKMYLTEQYYKIELYPVMGIPLRLLTRFYWWVYMFRLNRLK